MPTGNLELLINHLVGTGVLKTPAIIDAFKNIDRIDFVPDDAKQWAYIDEALSIKGGQTISQPYTVAFMLELLEPKPGEKILDIGAGSGWQTALLAHIVSDQNDEGKVFSVEVIPELCKFGEKNIVKYKFIEKGVVKLICGDASKEEIFGVVKNEISGGVDKIIVAASLAVGDSRRAALKEEMPQPWKDLLKVGGRIVVPIGNSIWLFIKRSDKNFESIEYPGFVFVPFVYDDGNTK